MHLPLLSEVLFTLTALLLAIGAHLADLSRTHVFNPKWMPHAKFHTGQTLALSLLFAGMTIWLSWRATTDYSLTLVAIVAFDGAYWVSQNLAILYPQTAFFDPDTRSIYVLGMPGQAVLGGLVMAVIGFATWWAVGHPRG